MKTERLIQMMFLMLNHDLVTAKYLAQKYEVSVRTIQRDMEALTRMGIPIYSEQGVNGGYFIPTSYRLDKHTLTSKEQALVIRTLKSVSTMVDDIDLNQAVAKLASVKTVNTQVESDWIDILPWEGTDEFSEVILLIKNSILDKKRLTFEYVKACGDVSLRKIDPLRVVLRGYSWYVYGYCHLRKENRLFKVNRIRKLTRINENAYTVFNEELYLTTGHELHEGIKIKCHQDIFYNGETYIDHSKIVVDEYGYFEAVLPFQVDHWTYGYLLSHCDFLEVLSPKYVREELARRAKIAISLYE
jgi:predicted DNA-binding transcriptional regulator YafY